MSCASLFSFGVTVFLPLARLVLARNVRPAFAALVVAMAGALWRSS